MTKFHEISHDEENFYYNDNVYVDNAARTLCFDVTYSRCKKDKTALKRLWTAICEFFANDEYRTAAGGAYENFKSWTGGVNDLTNFLCDNGEILPTGRSSAEKVQFLHDYGILWEIEDIYDGDGKYIFVKFLKHDVYATE